MIKNMEWYFEPYFHPEFVAAAFLNAHVRLSTLRFKSLAFPSHD
jgi:hypothetical protein